MADLTIHTGLSGFQMVDSITAISKTTITSTKMVDNAQPFLCLEAMAQTAALHVRWLLSCERHCFLLSVKSFVPPKSTPLSAAVSIKGKLLGQSQSAYSYALLADQLLSTGPIGSAELLIASAPYDETFQKSVLKPHYRSILSCLLKE